MLASTVLERSTYDSSVSSWHIPTGIKSYVHLKLHMLLIVNPVRIQHMREVEVAPTSANEVVNTVSGEVFDPFRPRTEVQFRVLVFGSHGHCSAPSSRMWLGSRSEAREQDSRDADGNRLGYVSAWDLVS
jgi:hypothetical protein